MLAIAVVDDDEKQRKQLCSFLEKYRTQHCLEWSVECFADGIDLMDSYAGQYIICFLDIQMKEKNGLDTAREIREKDADVILFFVTGFAQHATEGYEVDAKGFLVKPVMYPVFARHMDRAMKVLNRRIPEQLTLTNSRDMQRIPLHSIRHIENLGHYAKFYTDRGEQLERISLKELEKMLEGKPFFRISQKEIVNLDRIESIEQLELIAGGDRLTISRARKKPLMDALNQYLAGVGQ